MLEEREYLDLCARILRVDAQTLSLATAREDVASWDSIAHLRLVMEAEAACGGQVSLAQIPEIRTLGELREALCP